MAIGHTCPHREGAGRAAEFRVGLPWLVGARLGRATLVALPIFFIVEWVLPGPILGDRAGLPSLVVALACALFTLGLAWTDPPRYAWRVRITPEHLEVNPAFVAPARLRWTDVARVHIAGWGPFSRLLVTPHDLAQIAPVLAPAFTPAQLDRLARAARRRGAPLSVRLAGVTPGRSVLRRMLRDAPTGARS